MKGRTLKVSYNTHLPFFDYDTAEGLDKGAEKVVLDSLKRKHNVEISLRNMNFDWGRYDKELGRWTGAVGAVSLAHVGLMKNGEKWFSLLPNYGQSSRI